MKNFLKVLMYLGAVAVAVLLCAYICSLPEMKPRDDIELAEAVFCKSAAKNRRADLIEKAISRTENPYYLSDMYSSLALARELNGDLKARNEALTKISHPQFMAEYFMLSSLEKIMADDFSDPQKSAQECSQNLLRVANGARRAVLMFACALKLRAAGAEEDASKFIDAAQKTFLTERNQATRRAAAKTIADIAMQADAPDVFLFALSNINHDEDKLFLLCRGVSKPSFNSAMKAFASGKNIPAKDIALSKKIKLLLAANENLRAENLGKYEFGMKYLALGTRFKWGVKNWSKYYYPLAIAHAHFLGKEKLQDYFANEASKKDFVDGMALNGTNYCRYLSLGFANADMRERAVETLLSRPYPSDSAYILRANAEALSADPKFLDELFEVSQKLLRKIYGN